MSYESSMIYTMGMALSRALDNHATVDVLVNGEWVTGNVVISDGYGVVLEKDNEHSIVKIDQIAVVRINTPVPHQHRISQGAAGDTFSEPMPMPGPRLATTG